jgi:DNA-binding LytR/AlgR family response regulator
MAFTVGLIPTTIGYFWIKSNELQSNLQEKDDQNRKLLFRAREGNLSDEKLVTLSGNTKDALTLFPEELLFVESSANYVCVHYILNGRVAQKMLRTSLRQMEELLAEYPFIVRCHRAFIVNILQINAIKGLKIWLNISKQEIPVSKLYKAEILKQLQDVGFFSKQMQL